MTEEDRQPTSLEDFILDQAASAGYRSGWFDAACLAAEELELRGFWVAASIVRAVADMSELPES